MSPSVVAAADRPPLWRPSAFRVGLALALLDLTMGCATASTKADPAPPENQLLSARLFEIIGQAPRLIEIAGCRIRFLDAGEGEPDQPPWLAVHGLGGSMGDFGPLLAVAAENHRVLALDLPGFGGSSSPNQDYRVSTYARVLKSFLKTLAVKKVHLVCHSMGGQVCIAFALEHANQIATLTLIDAAGTYDQDTFIQAMLTQHTPLNAGRQHLAAFQFLDAITEGYQLLVLKRIIGDDSFLLAAMDSFKANYRHRIPDLSVPLLIIWGVEDAVFPVENAFFLKENVNRSELRLVESAGHSPHITHADLVVNWVSAFQRRQRQQEAPCPTPTAEPIPAAAAADADTHAEGDN